MSLFYTDECSGFILPASIIKGRVSPPCWTCYF